MKNISKTPNQETIQAMQQTDMGQTQKLSLSELRQEMGLKVIRNHVEKSAQNGIALPLNAAFEQFETYFCSCNKK